MMHAETHGPFVNLERGYRDKTTHVHGVVLFPFLVKNLIVSLLFFRGTCSGCMTTPGVATSTSLLGLSRSASDTATRTYMHVHVHVYHILSIIVKCEYDIYPCTWYQAHLHNIRIILT